jgi:MFS transporter, putative metabolite:H+ symporter
MFEQGDHIMSNNAADIVARIERLPVTGWHVKARIIVGTATFFDAYDSLTIAYVLPVVIGLWHIQQSDIGLLLAAGNAGQLIGALTFGWIADRIGRLRALVVGILLFALGSLACAFAYDFTSLFTLRTIEGIGLGGEVPVAAAYIGEMAKARGRGFFFLIYEGIFGIGLFAAALLGVWMVPRFGWQSMFIVGAVPALLALVLRRMLPESARWLADKGRLGEADEVVNFLERDAQKRGIELPPVKPIPLDQRVSAPWSELFSRFYRGRTFTVWVLWFCAYFVSYGISSWLPTLYRFQFKLDLQTSLTYGLITVASGLVGTLGVAFWVDKTGRKTWFIIAYIGSALPLLYLWLHGVTSAEMLVFWASITYFFTGSNSNLCYLYTAEIYPTRLRARGTATATAWLRLGSTIGPGVVGYIIGGYGLNWVFAMFGTVALIGALTAATFAIEAKERVLEEVSP